MKTQLLTFSLTAFLAAGPALGQEGVGTASYEIHDGSPGGATEQPAEKPKADDDLDELRAEAEAAGVDVDRRWGEKRLRDEISKAKKA